MKIIQNIFNKFMSWLDDYYSKDERAKIKELEEVISKKTILLDSNIVIFNENQLIISNLKQTIDSINEKKVIEEELEVYWNNKRPKSTIKHPARPIRNSSILVPVNPRIFFTNDSAILNVSGTTNDEKAKNSLLWVIANIKYTSDSIQFKIPEMWLFAFETFKLKMGDCEDGAILLANIMLNAGIPYWRIRLNAGDVKDFSHVWVSYLREKDDQWVVLDWCYYPTAQVKSLNKLYKDAENYLTTWFSWNLKYTFKGEKLR